MHTIINTSANLEMDFIWFFLTIIMFCLPLAEQLNILNFFLLKTDE